ncbi:MAG: conjugative transposon protein TraM [Bacteroidota bacterium]|nr:conjugative transposon protein TraM [Bacteroidota bacterium]MDP4268514.1 conjugative transposon protein TraM [Bacteroidota bacterium]
MKENNLPLAGSMQKLTSLQKQKVKKYAVFALLFVVFSACIWLIFSPSSGKKGKDASSHGFNPDLPLPKEQGIVKDKKVAYEQEQNSQKQQEKVRSLQDFAALLGQDGKNRSNRAISPAGNGTSGIIGGNPNRNFTSSHSSIQNSAHVYRNINRTLNTFYESPGKDSEKERLVKELEEAKVRLSENENRKSNMDDQMSLMEKSYQMAAKYMPQVQGQPNTSATTNVQASTRNGTGKARVIPVSQAVSQTVSSLQPPAGATSSGQARNTGFLTPTSTVSQDTKNTIDACIHNNQTVMNGQSVRLRLLGSMKVGSMVIPRNAIITGVAKVQEERLDITVSSLEYEGSILPVELSVYDTDGQQGISIPNTVEVNAAKEVVANMGTSTGTSISLAGNAGQQLAADMGRSLIQGASQLVSKKLREVKINLKAGYQVLLLPNDKQNSIQ